MNPDNIDVNALTEDYLLPWAVNIGLALLVFIVGRIVAGMLTGVLRKVLQRSSLDGMLINFFTSIFKSVLMLFVIIAALDQLGVDTTSIIALLGAAGLAVGLAMKDSLQNFAAGVLLILFRPFKTGDFVEAGGTSGVVEEIRIFTTTMRTGDNKQVIVPNGGIYADTITNYSAKATRRVDMVFGISYGDDIRKARDLIQAELDADERVLKDPAAVIAVGELGDSSVNLFVRPWCNTPDYWAVRFALTECIKLSFDANGISIPFPQMDVHMDKGSAD